MFNRMRNKVRTPDRSGFGHAHAHHGHGTEVHVHQQPQPQQRKPDLEASGGGRGGSLIESFYESLGLGLHNLENSLSANDSVSFQLEWLVLGVSFLHSVHADTFALVETEWLPATSVLGPDSLSDYLDVSMSLLDTCNNLKEALSQMETYQMSMDLILRRLMSAISQLQNLEASMDDDDVVSSSYLKPLSECKRELDLLDASNDSYNMWVELVPKYDLGQEKVLKANAPLPRTYSVYPLPATLVKKKKREVSVVLYDVQVVTSFVSCILLWLVTGQAKDEESPTQINLIVSSKPGLKEPRASSPCPSPWPTILFRLKDKVEQSIDYIRKSSNNRGCSFTKFQDLRSLQSSLKTLRAELERGLREKQFAHGTEFATKMKDILEQKKQKLTELTKSLERISAQLNEMFSEIIERRKKVLDICESRPPLYHAFSI
ncbi:hypothetical protein Mapa_011822 [Marchantia paleacea]|nr:hypothetical protein Mapa_011822 [Marchantia paleacea]